MDTPELSSGWAREFPVGTCSVDREHAYATTATHESASWVQLPFQCRDQGLSGAAVVWLVDGTPSAVHWLFENQPWPEIWSWNSGEVHRNSPSSLAAQMLQTSPGIAAADNAYANWQRFWLLLSDTDGRGLDEHLWLQTEASHLLPQLSTAAAEFEAFAHDPIQSVQILALAAAEGTGRFDYEQVTAAVGAYVAMLGHIHRFRDRAALALAGRESRYCSIAPTACDGVVCHCQRQPTGTLDGRWPSTRGSLGCAAFQPPIPPHVSRGGVTVHSGAVEAQH